MKTTASLIGQKTSHGYTVSRGMTFRANVVSGWVHVDEYVFGQWVWMGTIPGYRLGIADDVAYLDLGIHRPAVAEVKKTRRRKAASA